MKLVEGTRGRDANNHHYVVDLCGFINSHKLRSVIRRCRVVVEFHQNARTGGIHSRVRMANRPWSIMAEIPAGCLVAQLLDQLASAVDLLQRFFDSGRVNAHGPGDFVRVGKVQDERLNVAVKNDADDFGIFVDDGTA